MSGGRGEVLRDAQGRRLREHDGHGEPIATLAWARDGRLDQAVVRVPDGVWLTIKPRAAHDPRWGVSDLLVCGDTPLTHCAAVEWGAVASIPPLAEPARLPPGGGTAVLNLIADLAADQGCAWLAYRGPYPTEQLFLALLESFRWDGGEDVADPLAAFMAGALRWSPAPHARAFAPGGVYVQTRGRIEKLAWRGRAYYRADWQGVQRHGTHRVREAGGHILGSLWALDAPLEDHLVLTPDGRVLAAALPAAEAAPLRPMAPAIAAGVVAVVVAGSAAPLAEALRAVAAGLTLTWAPLAGEIAALDEQRALVSWRLRAVLTARMDATADRAARVRLGFAAVAELGHALGDALRARAQAWLAAATPAAQAAAFEARAAADAAAGARAIGLAVEALLEDVGQLRA